MDIDLAALPDDVDTLQRMVRTLATERVNLTEAQAEIERSSGSSFRSCKAANLAGVPNGSTTISCSSASTTSTPTSHGSKPRFHRRQPRHRECEPRGQACRRICP